MLLLIIQLVLTDLRRLAIEAWGHVAIHESELKKNLQTWIVNFHSKEDKNDDALIEFVYLQAAKRSGIPAAEARIIEAKNFQKYWLATKKFDHCVKNDEIIKFHMHSLAGLLHSNFCLPTLDYLDFIRATQTITLSAIEVQKAFAFGVFNSVFHNRDDHSKNFSYLMNAMGEWKLAPAYDLTFSYGLDGEHSTTINGEGKNPSIENLLELGKKSDISQKKANEIIEQVLAQKNWVLNELKGLGVSKKHGAVLNLKKQI
jgi:serine/threonine-protein kinase HipA